MSSTSIIFFYFINNLCIIINEVNFLTKQKSRILKMEEYESKYSSELDFLIYTIFNINITHGLIKEINDLEYLIFFQDRSATHEKINSSFVQLIYYIAINYEFVYKDLFNEISDSIHDSYKTYVNKSINKYIFLEVFYYIRIIFYRFFCIKIKFS